MKNKNILYVIYVNFLTKVFSGWSFHVISKNTLFGGVRVGEGTEAQAEGSPTYFVLIFTFRLLSWNLNWLTNRSKKMRN